MELVNIPQNNFEAVKAGLSDQCSPVIGKAIEKIFSFTNDPFSVGAVLFHGWKGLGKERILQYVAKRAVESKVFEVVIWMIERGKNVSTLRNFQRRVAEQLGVASSKNDDSDDDDDEQDVNDDNVIAGRIREYLEDKKFVLVHNGGWGLSDLETMGIPIHLGGAKKTMVLVASNNNEGQRYHEFISLEKGNYLSNQEVWDLVREVCVAIIADYPILRRAHHITPDVIMKCIMCASLLEGRPSYNLKRLWFSEGYIVNATLDLKTSFDIGQVLLEVLQDHCILDTSERLQPEVYNVIVSMAQLIGYNDQVLILPSVYDNPYLNLSPHCCSKLSTLFLYVYDRMKKLPENMFGHMINVRTLVISYGDIQSLHFSMIQLLVNDLVNLRYLKLLSCSLLDPLSLFPIKALQKIEMLDLSKTSFKKLPDDFFDGLQSLRLLDLSCCSKLLSFPSSMSCLINLEHLSLASCEELSCIPSSIHGLKKLQVLYLSKTKLIIIPQQFFQNMYKLKVLDLSFNRLLKSISMSVSNLVNCEKLDLQSCESLQTITPWLGDHDVSLPIQDLNQSSCSSLQNIVHVISSVSTTFSNIKSLNLSFTPVNQLSLKICSSLETIHLQSNTTLEKLDLSGTKVNNFLLSGDLNLVRLKQFAFLNMKPRGLNNWDNCGDGSTPHMHIKTVQMAQRWKRRRSVYFC